MRLVLTSDWQCEFHNLSSCETAAAELLTTAKEEKPDAIIFAGDMKEHYNPVDIRVIQFYGRTTRDLVARGFRVIYMLGNHDRISQSLDSKDWLNILKLAGAEIVTKPKVKAIGDSVVAFMPYTSSRKQEAEWGTALAIEASEQRALMPHGTHMMLVFHTDVTGAVMNSAGLVVGEGVLEGHGASLDSLHIHDYDSCFGGHLHKHQAISGNTWYIGSPFTQGWDEANQKKGHLVVDTACSIEDSNFVRQIVTKLPHWYDAEWLEERRKNCKTCKGIGYVADAKNVADSPCPKCSPEPGALVRSRVAVTTKKITAQLKHEDERLHNLFPGVRTLVVPKLISKKADIDLSGATDRERVEQYVAATMPEAAEFSAERAVRYLCKKMAASAGNRLSRSIRFMWMKGRNVLSFPKIDIKYDKLGLVLLKGVNRDWKEEGGGTRSNGAGKTSFLSLLPIALDGASSKGQKHDQWAREHTKKPAWLKLCVQDDQNREIEVLRGRRPGKIQMWIDGEDKSTGMRGVGKQETQGQIENELGYNRQLLMNSVYIDQTIANGFLFGTQKDKMDLIGKLEDLTRFQAAQKLVSADITEMSEKSVQLEKKIDRTRQELDGLRDDRKECVEEVRDASIWLKKEKAASKEVKRALTAYQGTKGTQSFYEAKQQEVDAATADRYHAEQKLRDLNEERSVRLAALERIERLIAAGKCGKCGQPVEESAYPTKKKRKTLALVEKLIAGIQKQHDDAEEKAQRLEDQIHEFRLKLDDEERDLATARQILATAQSGAETDQARREQTIAKRTKIIGRIKEAKQSLQSMDQEHRKLSRGLEMRYYAAKALHRSGIPLYLCANLCEQLNVYAEEYSEIFWEGRIKTQFSIEDGELTASVVNPSGSSKTAGQSVGEAAMAGLLTAFALREAGAKTNLLILDEPGSGLDQEGQKQFARGIMKLRDSGRFSTIILTTHSSVIQGILEGETIWKVVKKNRRSRLICG